VTTLELVSPSDPGCTALVSTVGAGLRSLQVAGHEIIPDYPTNHAPAYAGVVMFPWAGRVPAGRWADGDHTRTLPINDDETSSALHGLVWGEEFEVHQQTPWSVTLVHTLAASTGYPYRLALEVSFALGDGGLVVTDRVLNPGQEVAPFALAHHPYFQLAGASLAETSVSASVVGTMARTAHKIPISLEPFDSSGLPLPVLEIDDTYALDFGANTRASALLSTPAGVIEMWQSHHWPWLHVYSTGAFPSAKGPIAVVALEPQTAVPNSLNWPDQLIYLSPGAVWEGDWGIRFLPPGVAESS
jgi:aldose 1-epimerase